MNEIKEFRGKLGLTQEALARELGISVETVRRWEGGKTQPSPMARRLLEELQEKGPK